MDLYESQDELDRAELEERGFVPIVYFGRAAWRDPEGGILDERAALDWLARQRKEEASE